MRKSARKQAADKTKDIVMLRPDLMALVLCPGCVWKGKIDDLGTFGQCPKCGYENGNPPGRLLTINELLLSNSSFDEVVLGPFLRKICELQQSI